MMIRKDNDFYFSFISIKIEDILFRIPRENLEKESAVIRGLFNGDGKPKGLSDEDPLILDDVSASDFRAFLKARSPEFLLLNQNILGEKEIISALILSDKWQLGIMRRLLIEKLERLSLHPARKLELAQQHRIHQWYRKELHELASRERWLSLEEAQQLGLGLTVVLGGLRETRKRKFSEAFHPDSSMLQRELDKKLDEYINMDQFPLACLRDMQPLPSFTYPNPVSPLIDAPRASSLAPLPLPPPSPPINDPDFYDILW